MLPGAAVGRIFVDQVLISRELEERKKRWTAGAKEMYNKSYLKTRASSYFRGKEDIP